MKRLILPAVLMLAACTPDYAKMSTIVPMPENTYQVSSSWKTQQQATQWALDAAEATCKKRRLRHVVTEQRTAYKGMVSETANERTETIKGIAESVAGPVAPGFSLRGRYDYTVQLTFRCEA